jgi:hypothetical protein
MVSCRHSTQPQGKATIANDPVENLIDVAYALFFESSVYEVIDLDREMAVERLIYFYGPMIDIGKVDRYLAVVDELRAYERDVGLRPI